MKTRPKDLGTAKETADVKAAQARGLMAERLAEGGAYDRGDIRILTDHEWIGECKARSNLNLHQTLARAIVKSGTRHTFVSWKRLVRVDGSARRVAAGPDLVAMTYDTFLDLLLLDTDPERKKDPQ